MRARMVRRWWKVGLASVVGLLQGCTSLDAPRIVLDPADLADLVKVSFAAREVLEAGFVVHTVSVDAQTSEHPFLVLTAIRANEPTYAQTHDDNNYRQLLILRQESPSLFALVATSKKALAPYGWDEFSPDSLEEVTIKGDTLAISHYGGGRQRWSRTDTFVYDAWAGVWSLAAIELIYSDTQKPDEEGERWRLTKTNFGSVPLADFDIRKRPGQSGK